MKRFAPYLGIIPATAFFIFILALADSSAVSQIPAAPGETASSTLFAGQDFAMPAITLHGTESFADAAMTSMAKTAPAPKKEPSPAPKPALEPGPPVAAPLPISTPAPSSSPDGNIAFDTAASALREAAVNIICYVPPGVGLHSISGSGVFVDSKGIIITNAHIAQYFLLEDKGTACTIRTGSPAADKYKASLIYIPYSWLAANPKVLTETLPRGTGEDDYALLAVTKSATSAPLPSAFPSLPLGTTPPDAGTPVVIATYGAQFLGAGQIRNALFPTVVFGSVKDIFTFAVNTVDVLALGGSAAAQEGSSGGGVADASGKLVGVITTSTVTGATDTRSLAAITAPYIRADYAGDTGEALDLLLSKDTAASVAAFAPKIPALEAIITVGLP